MSDPVSRLARAEAEASLARERLSMTMAALQGRLEPRRLARDARREIADAGSLAAQRTVTAARERPRALAGLVAVAGLFLARHRVVALLRWGNRPQEHELTPHRTPPLRRPPHRRQGKDDG